MATQTKRPSFIKLLTPAGIAIYPKLNTPDTKYKPLGEFSVKLKLSEEEAQPIIEAYEGELARYFDEVKAELLATTGPKAGAAKAKAKALKMAADKPYKPELDDEAEETGFVVFNFKMPNRIAREGKEDLVLVPDVFDAGGKKLAKVPDIWGGSTLRVSGELRPFNAPIGVGVSLRLKAVQILELKSGGQRDAAGYGFGAEEGFTGSDEAAPAASSDNDGADASADNQDF